MGGARQFRRGARHPRPPPRYGNETISAELLFDDASNLVDFISDDRSAASKDGKTFTVQRWTTPVKGYRSFGPRRVVAHGEARWEPQSGAFTYLELDLDSIEDNVIPTSSNS
jgi:hypothetical protein